MCIVLFTEYSLLFEEYAPAIILYYSTLTSSCQDDLFLPFSEDFVYIIYGFMGQSTRNSGAVLYRSLSAPFVRGWASWAAVRRRLGVATRKCRYSDRAACSIHRRCPAAAITFGFRSAPACPLTAAAMPGLLCPIRDAQSHCELSLRHIAISLGHLAQDGAAALIPFPPSIGLRTAHPPVIPPSFGQQVLPPVFLFSCHTISRWPRGCGSGVLSKCSLFFAARSRADISTGQKLLGTGFGPTLVCGFHLFHPKWAAINTRYFALAKGGSVGRSGANLCVFASGDLLTRNNRPRWSKLKGCFPDNSARPFQTPFSTNAGSSDSFVSQTYTRLSLRACNDKILVACGPSHAFCDVTLIVRRTRSLLHTNLSHGLPCSISARGFLLCAL